MINLFVLILYHINTPSMDNIQIKVNDLIVCANNTCVTCHVNVTTKSWKLLQEFQYKSILRRIYETKESSHLLRILFFNELTSLSYNNIKLEKSRRITHEKYFVIVYWWKLRWKIFVSNFQRKQRWKIYLHCHFI